MPNKLKCVNILFEETYSNLQELTASIAMYPRALVEPQAVTAIEIAVTQIKKLKAVCDMVDYNPPIAANHNEVLRKDLLIEASEAIDLLTEARESAPFTVTSKSVDRLDNVILELYTAINAMKAATFTLQD